MPAPRSQRNTASAPEVCWREGLTVALGSGADDGLPLERLADRCAPRATDPQRDQPS